MADETARLARLAAKAAPRHRIREFVAATYGRLGADDSDQTPWRAAAPAELARLKDYLAAKYDGSIESIVPLDTAVFRVDWHDRPPWVARVFPRSRPLAEVETDQAVIVALAHWGSVERSIPDGVGELDGEAIWVTGFSDWAPRRPSIDDAAALGDFLGRLQALPDEAPFARRAGAWHNLTPAGGTRRDDFDVLERLLVDTRSLAPRDQRDAFSEILDTIESADPGDDLPHGFSHVDLHEPNLLWCGSAMTVVDWAGAGRASRVSMLPLMPYWRELDKVDAFCRAYRRHIVLDEAELARLASALRSHGLVIDAWTAVFVPTRVSDILKKIRHTAHAADVVAGRMRENLSMPDQRQR